MSTFKAAFEEACAVDPTDSISISVAAWRYGSTAQYIGDTRAVRWNVWSQNMNKNFPGVTAADAVQGYLIASERVTNPLDPETQMELVDAEEV